VTVTAREKSRGMLACDSVGIAASGQHVLLLQTVLKELFMASIFSDSVFV
jgi:hypothetical protein